jgi:tetratricopeptide (TPR) repeat protein
LSRLDELVAALLAAPESEDLAGQVRELAKNEKAFGTWARVFVERGDRLAAAAKTKEAIHSFVDAAQVFEEELGELERAVECYDKVLGLEEDHRRALFALGTLYHDLSRWDDLIALYRRRLGTCHDDGERTTLHLYIAELLSERLSDDHAAFEEVMTASRLAPQNIRIISRLQQLGERTKRVEEVAVVIGDLIMNQDDPRIRAALSLRLAELHLGPLSDHQRALAYLRAALHDDGGNPEILQGVEDVFRERKRFDELTALLEEAAKDRREGPHRIRLERELARIFELELEDFPRALGALKSALQISPEDRELLDEVMRIGLAGGELGTVAEIYEWVTASTANALLKTYLRLKLGHIYANVLGQHADATRVYWAILDDEPMHKEARRRLMKLHERRDEHEKIAQLLEIEVAELGGAREAADVLGRLADLYEKKLEEPELAIIAYQRMLEVDPSSLRAKQALERRAEPQPPPPKVATDDLLLDEVVGSSMVAAISPDEEATEFEGEYGPESETLFASAARSEPKASEVGWAGFAGPGPDELAPPKVEEWEPVLDELDQLESFVEVATGRAAPPPSPKGPPPPPPPDEEPSIEEPRRRPPMPPPPIPREPIMEEDTREASDAVIEVEVDEHGFPGLDAEQAAPVDRLTALQQELQAATDQDDRARIIALLEEVVKVTEDVGQTQRAFFSMVRLAQLEPSRDRLFEVIRLGRAAQGYPLLIDTVQKASESAPPDLQVELQLALADVELDDLSDPSAAASRLEQIASASADPRPFQRLSHLFGSLGRYEDRVDLLLERAKALEPSEAWELVRAAAHLAEQELADPKRAVAMLLDFAKRAPLVAEVRDEGAAILERAGAWSDLAMFLSEGLSRLEGEDRAGLRLRIAQIYEERLGDHDSAERIIRLGLEERARDERLLEALERITQASGRWEDVIDARIRRLDAIENAKARAELRREIARIAERSLGRVDLALDMLSSALVEDPGNMELFDEVERLRRDRGDWEGVVDILERRVQVMSDRELQAKTHVSIARIRADELHDLDSATAALGAALACIPRYRPALELLADVAERRGDHDRAREALERLVEEGRTADRGALLVRIGRLHAIRGDELAAFHLFEQAHEADPSLLDAILALLPIAEAAADFVRAEELASRGAELSRDLREKADLHRRAGEIAHARIGDERRALEHFLRVLEADPEDLATAARTGEILLARKEWAAAYPHLIRSAGELADPARSSELYHQAGAAAERLGKPNDAIDAYERALERTPASREGLERLSALLDKRGDPQRIYEVSALLILHHEAALSALERAPVYARMARAKQMLSDPEAAARLAKKAHQLDPEQIEPLEILSKALVAVGDAFEAAEALKKISIHVRDPGAKRDRLVEAARLLAEGARDHARACAMLAEAQTLIEGDLEVADLLANYREELGDGLGAAQALAIAAKHRAGRERADLLVRAARLAAGLGRDRMRAKAFLVQAVESVPTHREARSDLEVMLEFDGDLLELAGLSERAAYAFVEDESTAADAAGDRRSAAAALLDRALEIYRHRLDVSDRALIVSRQLLQLEPDVARHREGYARLLDAVAGTSPRLLDESINVWSEIVERDPANVQGLERLMRLRAQRGDHALARIVYEVLEALGRHVEFPENGAARTRVAPPLDTQVINAVRAVRVPPHPDEESPLAAMFNGLGYAPIRAFEDAVPEPKPKKRDAVGAAGLGIHVARPLEYAARVIGIDVPPAFVRDDAPFVCEPRLVGETGGIVVSLALAEKRREEELRFLIGRCLSLLRPRSLALAIVPLEVLREGLAGLAKIDDAASVHVDAKQSKRRGRALEKAIPPNSRTRLVDLASKWMADPHRPSLAAERASVLRTADRAGLLASGSVAAAVEALKALSDGRIERVWHIPLLRFATTRAFAQLLEQS